MCSNVKLKNTLHNDVRYRIVYLSLIIIFKKIELDIN
jgi:hypothetical protein